MNEVIESAEAASEEEGTDFEVVAMDEDLNTAEAQAADEAAAEDNAAPHVQSMAERMAVIEALVFVADEPLSTKTIAEVLKEDRQLIEESVAELEKDFNGRNSGLQLREVGGGWQFATRAEYHEHVRAFLKSRPSAKLSLASLETLAVIAYKQPVTVPEILEIRGVQSPSSIKTLLDKKLIVAKGRKDTVGRPMMYGTSKEFLIQFGLKDLSELPSIEDFEDLAGGA
jgi:segregation and condensation protein B